MGGRAASPECVQRLRDADGRRQLLGSVCVTVRVRQTQELLSLLISACPDVWRRLLCRPLLLLLLPPAVR